MDVAPFTIFFMACLMGFSGNSAADHGCFKSVEWPKKCANKAYCHVKPKGYPTTSQFKAMVENSNFDFSTVPTPAPTDREADNICRYTHEKGYVYMIKDTNDATRFVVQDPALFKLQSTFKECKKQVQLLPTLVCHQDFTTWKLPVTRCDGKGIELYNVSIPVNCGARVVSDYED